MSGPAPHGESPVWKPERPRFRPFRLLLSWLVAAASLLVAAYLVPGVAVHGFGGAVVASLIAVLNAVVPPIVAALRLPFMLLLGFVLVLLVDAAMLLLAARRDRPGRSTSTASLARCWPRS